MSELLRCENLTKSYSGMVALNSVNLSVGSGKIIGLLGPNGSGKTTLIKILNGLLTPTSGDLFICGDKPGVHAEILMRDFEGRGKKIMRMNAGKTTGTADAR